MTSTLTNGINSRASIKNHELTEGKECGLNEATLKDESVRMAAVHNGSGGGVDDSQTGFLCGVIEGKRESG